MNLIQSTGVECHESRQEQKYKTMNLILGTGVECHERLDYQR